MVSAVKYAILLILSSISLSLGHRFLLQEDEHKIMDLVPVHKGEAATLPWLNGGDHAAVESKIGGHEIPELHRLCVTCNCGKGGGGKKGDYGIPLLGDIPLIGEIPEILGGTFTPAQQSPTTTVDENQGMAPVCGCCGERCGGSCGCGGRVTGGELEEAKDNVPHPTKADHKDTIGTHT